ncbi:MAG: phenylalanine--tRNA ligase subunit beta [Gemmatimonadetes bacterium]|nr:phenylalanine--tRNA ligase subunit beta [Gemmatimonadota bacterium]
MNISYRWLQALLPGLNESPQRVADHLAMQGAPVDELVDLGGPLREVRIARVIERRQHPNADRLSLCRVDAGTGEELQVVCGAPNVRTGGVYPFIPVGGTLPGNVLIRKAKIRGYESQGMLCSARELGLGRDHEGILELHGDLPIGAAFTEAVQLDDYRLVVDVTPNRPDLLSHLGVAREIGAEAGIAPVLPAFPNQAEFPAPRLERGDAAGSASADGVSVRLEDTVLCPRYLGLVIRDVTIGPSPEWLAGRLRAIGQRPISNVVDATNYVLHELGQPLHAFDLDRLGSEVVVRKARPGEGLTTLDEAERVLGGRMLVIADAERPVALAGIMGGADTEVHPGTRNLLVECALFDPRSIRGTRRGLDLTTDASSRFERGVDATGMEQALRRVAVLIVTVAGGRVATAAADAGPGVSAPPPITLRQRRLTQVLGAEIPLADASRLLQPLGFRVEAADDQSLRVLVPGHRWQDVRAEIDLVEEVARRHGYDSFPAGLGGFRPTAVPDDPLMQLEDRLRSVMVGLGLLEARTAAFAPEAEGDVALLRPLSAAESRLRRALVPGLLHRVEFNFTRGSRHIRLFELGTAFAPGQTPPAETRRLALALTGARTPPHWSGPAESLDLWDLKGLLEEVASELGLRLEPGEPAAPWLEPAAAFRLVDGAGQVSGWGGKVRAAAIDAPPWAEPVFAAELLLESLPDRSRSSFRELPAFPASERDLSLLVPDVLDAADVIGTVTGAAGPLLEQVEPFDLYRGTGIPAGTRSLALRLRFRAGERTLTDAEVDGVVARVLKRLRESHGIERRG